MVTQYDEKGKIFTRVVSKEPVQVMIQTAQNMIRGLIHVRLNERTKDELNESEGFIAVTDATIFNLQNEEMYRVKFMLVNIHQIIWVIPEEETTH
jgi:hypothetical protein